MRRDVLSETTKLPKTMHFSSMAYTGELAEVVREIITYGRPGLMLEFYSDDVLMGVGAAVKHEDRTAKFMADVTSRGLDQADIIVLQTAKAAAELKPKTVWTLIPEDKLQWYKGLAPWRSETYRDFPVTKLA